MFCVGILTPTAAQEEENQLEIIVVGSRFPQADAPVGITLIDKQEIGRSSGATVLDALDYRSGVRAFSNGGPGGGSFLSVRGGEPNFTQVFLEDVKLNDPTNSAGGAFDFAQIDPLAIERVEILKSGASAITGADSLSGSVHIRLRDPREELGAFLSTSAFAESEGAVGINALMGKGWGNGGLMAGAGGYDSGGLYDSSELNRKQGLLRLVQTSERLVLDLIALAASTNRRAFPEDSGGVELAVNRALETRSTDFYVAGAKLSSRFGALSPTVAANWSRQVSAIDTPAIAPGVFDGVPAIESRFAFERFEAIGDVRARIAPSLQLALGGSHLREAGSGDSILDLGFLLPAGFNIERTITSGFVELFYQSTDWFEVKGALRYDDPNSSSPETTYRLTSRLISEKRGWSAAFTLAENYRLPSLFALAFPLTANPDLEVERGRSMTLSVQKSFKDVLSMEVSFFRSRFTDLIDFDPALFTTVNRSAVLSRGAEVSVVANLSDRLDISGSATFLDTDNLAEGTPPLRARPEWQAAFSMGYAATKDIDVWYSLAYTDDFFNSSIPTGLVSLDRRLQLNAGVSWETRSGLELTLSGRNLLSADYQDAVGTPEPEAVIRFGIGYEFRRADKRFH